MIYVPFDADEYEGILQELIKNSKFVKQTAENAVLNMSDSFNV